VKTKVTKRRNAIAKRVVSGTPKRPKPLVAYSSPNGRGTASESRNVANRSSVELKQRESVFGRLRLPKVHQVRDIGELTFGKRKAHRKPLKLVKARPPAIGLVGRMQVQNTTVIPWRKISDLWITARDGSFHAGTGWFISPTMLLTAGHCISVFRPGTPAVHGMVRSILVMPARNGE